MNRRLPVPLRALCTAVAVLGTTSASLAQSVTPVVYPAKGQSAQQQDKDRYECHDWARRQSGYDPTRPATPTTAAASPTPAGGTGASAGSPAGSMTAGALGGAAIAELGDHDAGRGAAIGALGGAALGKLKEARQQQARQQQQVAQQQAQQQAAQGQQRSVYDRSWAACLDARGYTVR